MAAADNNPSVPSLGIRNNGSHGLLVTASSMARVTATTLKSSKASRSSTRLPRTIYADGRSHGIVATDRLFLQSHADAPAVAQSAMAEEKGQRVGVRQTPDAFVKIAQQGPLL
jgi:hypothetical protein